MGQDILTIDNLVQLAFISIVTFSGAMINDYTNTLTGKDKNVKMGRVFVSAITASILMFAFYNQLKFVGDRLFVFLCFVSGATGFELFGSVTKIKMFKIVGNISPIKLEEDEFKGSNG